MGRSLGSQGTDRLGRVPRGKEVRARVIESLHTPFRRATGYTIVAKSRQCRELALLTHPSVGRVEVSSEMAFPLKVCNVP